MKLITKNLSLIILAFLTLVVSYAAIQLQALPYAILKSVGITELEAQESANSVAYQHYIPLVAALFLVVLLVLSSLWKRYGNADDQIIYVDRAQKYAQSNAEETETDAESEVQGKIDDLKYWLSGDAQKIKEEKTVQEKLFSKICNELEAVSAGLFIKKEEEGKEILAFETGYAFLAPKEQKLQYQSGEGLVGQAYKSNKALIVSNVPDDHINVLSGLGESQPKYLTLLPVQLDDTNCGVIEVATFKAISKNKLTFLKEAATLLVLGIKKPTPSVETEA